MLNSYLYHQFILIYLQSTSQLMVAGRPGEIGTPVLTLVAQEHKNDSGPATVPGLPLVAKVVLDQPMTLNHACLRIAQVVLDAKLYCNVFCYNGSSLDKLVPMGKLLSILRFR